MWTDFPPQNKRTFHFKELKSVAQLTSSLKHSRKIIQSVECNVWSDRPGRAIIICSSCQVSCTKWGWQIKEWTRTVFFHCNSQNVQFFDQKTISTLEEMKFVIRSIMKSSYEYMWDCMDMDNQFASPLSDWSTNPPQILRLSAQTSAKTKNRLAIESKSKLWISSVIELKTW